MRVRRLRSRKSIWSRFRFWKRKPEPKRWTGGWWWKYPLLLGLILFGVLFFYTWFVLPDVDESAEFIFSESTIIYDRGALDKSKNPNDHILYVIHGEENREYIPLEEMSPLAVSATLAIEDDQFYDHSGFDIGGILKGGLYYVFGIGSPRGGSTITQQLVKNTFLTNERSLKRKFNELFLSIKLELAYTKDEILELYLNKIPYGNNAYGIEAAAKTYFGKSARDLNLIESAILASIPNAPTKYSPYGSNVDALMGYDEFEDYYSTLEEAEASDENVGEEAKTKSYKQGRKDLVLQRMLELDMITQTEFSNAWIQGFSVNFRRAVDDIRAPHFVFYVRQRLEEKYGKEFLAQGGLKIYTTLDPELQSIAEKVIENQAGDYADKYKASNAALVAIYNQQKIYDSSQLRPAAGVDETGRGQILAYIGGKDFFDTENDGQVDVLTSRRQPGSSFKPMVYAAGFEKGLTPGTVVFDVETNFGTNARPYEPQNFDEKFRGPVSFRESLNSSLNIPAIKMAYLASPKNVLDLAKRAGIKYEGTAGVHGVAVGVGVAEVEPLSHINSLQTFAGDGSYYEPTAILKIENADGVVLESTDIQSKKKSGINPEVAALVRHILTDEKTRPTDGNFSWNKYLQLENIDNGAKTGTSNRVVKNPDYKPGDPEDEKFNTVPGDSWTVGFTPGLVTGVWVGNNRGEPMESGATGLTVAAPIWKEFNEQAHALLVEKGFDPETVYEEPKPLTEVVINKYSGKRASKSTPQILRKNEVAASFAPMTEWDNSVVIREIDLLDGRFANEETPDYARSKEPILTLKSIRPSVSNWQNPVQTWMAENPLFATSLGQLRGGAQWTVPESVLVAQAKANAPEPEPEEAPESLLDRIGEAYGPTEVKTSPRSSYDPVTPQGTSNTSNQTSSGAPAAQFPQVSLVSSRIPLELEPGTATVEVRVSSGNPVKTVEYFLENRKVATTNVAPYTGKFSIPSNLSPGRDYTLRIRVTDSVGSVAEKEATVRLAKDTKPPIIMTKSPKGNQTIKLGESVVIEADVIDKASTVARVEFMIDNQVLGSVSKAPYTTSFTAEGSLGRRLVRIIAFDEFNNRSERRVPVSFVE